MSNLQKRKEGGFTIIEVLIVLAIAGLIMLIVFLAVPALQRNSRNTQVKNAASSILGAVSEYQNNNGGTNPTTAAIAADGTVTISGATGTASSTAKVQSGYALSLGATMPTSGTGVFVLNLGHKCSSPTAFDTGTSTPRAFSIGFTIESSSTAVAPQCVES